MKTALMLCVVGLCLAVTSYAAPAEEFARADKLLSIGGCRIMDMEDFLVLLSTVPPSGKAYAVTNQQYSPPFAVKAKVQTDSTNIRLYYAAGEIILNWEVNQDELRFHNLVTGQPKGFPGMGHVTPMKWHDIVWEIRPTSTRLLVDGEERLNTYGDHEDLKGPIGIGPCFESILMLESFAVTPLEPEAAEEVEPPAAQAVPDDDPPAE